MVEHFASWGGLPLLAVFDRPKTIALSWSRNGVVTEWNPTFGAIILDLGVGVELCWPHSPEQKGAVENLVGWVKGSFRKQRRFVDDEPPSTARRVAPRGQHAATVARDAYRARGAAHRGAAAASSSAHQARRAAFEVGLAHGAIGAEYIHHHLTNTPGVVPGAVHQELTVDTSDLDIDALLERLHLANARRTWRDLVARAEIEQWSWSASRRP